MCRVVGGSLEKKNHDPAGRILLSPFPDAIGSGSLDVEERNRASSIIVELPLRRHQWRVGFLSKQQTLKTYGLSAMVNAILQRATSPGETEIKTSLCVFFICKHLPRCALLREKGLN